MLEVVSTLVIIFKAVIVISWLRLLILSASPFMVWQILPLITGMIRLNGDLCYLDSVTMYP